EFQDGVQPLWGDVDAAVVAELRRGEPIGAEALAEFGDDLLVRHRGLPPEPSPCKRGSASNRPRAPIASPAGTSSASGFGASDAARWLNSTPLTVPVRVTLAWMSMSDCSSCSGRGGQPGTYTSTGINRSMPCTTAYVSNTPPLDAQAPIEMHHFG